MICCFSFKNFMSYKEKVEVSFCADERIKRFLSNSADVEGNKKKILKTVGIYGPNNTGKTCLIEAFNVLSLLMKNHAVNNVYNYFSNSQITDFEVIYNVNKTTYKYDLSYDSFKHIVVKESLSLVGYNPSNKYIETYANLFVRDDKSFSVMCKKNEKPLNITQSFIVNPGTTLFNAIEFNTETLIKGKSDFNEFANSLEIIKMDQGISTKKTIDLIQNDKKGKKFIINFIKNCDLNIDDFGFDNNIKINSNINGKVSEILDKNVNIDSFKFWSKHHGSQFPSFLIDSVGTRKIVALSSYIYDALVNGKILVVDELDSSLHHIITRAILSMFNNDLNKKAQLIFTTHDIMLLDLKHLMRKDQIILTNIKDDGECEIYPLSSYTANEDGLRGFEAIQDWYIKGKFGGVPTPDLFESLQEAVADDN